MVYSWKNVTLSFLMTKFRGVRSTQVLGGFFPGLGTRTIPEHYSVGSVTLEITPMSSILFNSVCTASLRGKGTLLGAERATGMAPWSSSMW